MGISDYTQVEIRIPFKIQRLIGEFEEKYYFGNELFDDLGFVKFIFENVIPVALNNPSFSTIEIVKASIEINTIENNHSVTEKIFENGLVANKMEFDPEKSWEYVHYAQEQMAIELHDSFPSLVRLIDDVLENGFIFIETGDSYGIKRIELISINRNTRTLVLRISR